MTIRRVIAVFVGGGLGACARAALLQAWSVPGSQFPLPVLFINLIGSFALGAVFVLADETGLMRVEARLFLAVGILGGFTTFSTFGWEAALFLGNGQDLLAAVYVGVSLLGGLVACAAGIIAGREFVDILERGAHGLLARLETRKKRTGTLNRDMGLVETDNREETA